MTSTNQQRTRTDTARYQELLDERVRLGRACVDHVVHQRAHQARHLSSQAQQLDRRLSRFERYRWDEFVIVSAAEDERWHVAGMLTECALCTDVDSVFLAQFAPATGDATP